MSEKEIGVRLVELELRVSELEKLLRVPNVSVRGAKELTVKEFILNKLPKNDVEKTLAIGYYLERFSGLSSFNVDDLTHHFQLAKEAIPLNVNDKVNLNIKKGHLAEAKERKGNKKAWIVTNSGEQFVERGFKG